MPMQFEFATAGRIIVGPGTLAQVAPIAAELGSRALVVTGRSPARAGPLLAGLAKAGVATVPFSVEGEPTTDHAARGTELAADERCDMVVGIGGGGALDAGKAVAALLANGSDPLDFLEVIGRGKPLERPSLPYIAIPTTAGTGTEATRNAVLASPEHRVKVSLRSPHMLPRVAVVDPELTYGLPSEITASTGVDALTQLIEPYVSVAANPLTDALCREGMTRAARSLRRACERGGNNDARLDMSIAGLFGGLALANARLGAVHGFAAPIGGMFPAPHGAVCACLLPHVMAVNLAAIRKRQPNSPALRRYDEIAQLLTATAAARADDAVAWVENLCKGLSIPPLSAHGMAASDVSAVVEKASKASSMKGNAIALTGKEMTEILTRAL